VRPPAARLPENRDGEYVITNARRSVPMPWLNDKQYELRKQETASAPDQSGVFGLAKPGAWIYIASTNNIRQALMYYLEGNMPWVSQQRPVEFAFETVDKASRTARCSELTTEYKPVFLNCV
jgi:hypothetical protein